MAAVCVSQLEFIGWQLNLLMAQSSQSRMKSPSAVLQLGLRSEDSEVHARGTLSISSDTLLLLALNF